MSRCLTGALSRQIVRGLVLFVSVVCSGQADARSQALWSERKSSARPLAQVPNFSELAASVVPAVVSIQVEQAVKPGADPNDPFSTYLHRFFGGEVPREFHNRGIGTGFVIRSDGLILTNYHVVEGADSIEVTFGLADGSERKLEAEVLGKAPNYDVALIKTLKNANVPVAFLGDSDGMRIGDWVMAVGNPFGLTHSVSVGIISAKDRREIAPSGRQGLYDFIQTDASINPGNSGGPLINMRGEVIGINTAINAAGAGIGFAIPMNMVKRMLPDLKKKGRYSRSWIGIKIQPLTDDLAKSYGRESPVGALVSEVVSSSPAEQAGLKEGDVIILFDGKVVRNSSDLPLYASMAGIGKRVELKLWRDGREHIKYVVLEEFPTQAPAAANETSSARGQLGLTVADITPPLRRQFGLDARRGIVVREIEPGSIAARHGVRAGDLIVSLNGAKMQRARQFADAVGETPSGGLLRLKISRENGQFYLAIRKP